MRFSPAKVSISGKRKKSQVFKVQNFEDLCNLLALCETKLQGEKVGCYINRDRSSVAISELPVGGSLRRHRRESFAVRQICH